MKSRERALRVALQAVVLPVEDRAFVLSALLGFGSDFDLAIETNPEIVAQPQRPLAEILSDLEAGAALGADEFCLIEQLAGLLPPRSSAERDGVIHLAIDTHVPADAASVRSHAAWLRARYVRFVAGADWKRTRRATVCPYSRRDIRFCLWKLAKFGELPTDRHLRTILSEGAPTEE